MGMIRLNICPDNPNRIFASVGKPPGSSACTGSCNYGLYLSINGGSSWSQAYAGANYIDNQGWYSHDVIAAPTTINTVYISEVDMLKSTNGGTSFSKITNWAAWNLNNTTVGTQTEGTSANYVHADHHHIYFSPFDNTYKTIFVVTDGGTFKSTNSGASFIGLNGGLMTVQIYHRMSASVANPGFMLCGLQDNATMWYAGAAGSKRVIGGDGFYTAIDPINDQTCYGSYAYLTLYKSTSGANGLNTGTTLFNNPSSTTTSTPSENACFVAPFVLAP